MNTSLDQYVPFAARVSLAAVFLVAGVGKLLNFAGTVDFIAGTGVPAATLLAVLAVLFEIGGGVLILLGWQTRWGALALIVFAIVATGLFHMDLGDQLQMTMFLKNLAIIGGLLLLWQYGAGPWSVDERTPSVSV